MNEIVITGNAMKFRDPDRTAAGEIRASVPLEALRTLWINTGSLCNIECRNCYIESTPTNDRLAYISRTEARVFLHEIAAAGLLTEEIGFTGGEPFMNADIIEMLGDALARGFRALVLTNAMQPMLRPRIQSGLLALHDAYGSRLVIRVSLDHYAKVQHEEERGEGTYDKTLEGIDWLAANGFAMALAGRNRWGESEAAMSEGYRKLAEARGWPVDVSDPGQLVLFPEMDETAEVPEITTACWGILGKRPSDVMCASSRMVVKRKGAAAPVVLPCTLLPYDAAFEMGASLTEAARADGGMFTHGAVKLCHPHCAKFCVLGGGSCSS